ncbi:nucleotidyl transferase AbiEii/AbiGii toxin family protein [Saccharomonospora sp. NPDC006951]
MAHGKLLTTTMSYSTPSALHSALASRARARSRITGIPQTELINRFYLSRLMARVFTHDPAGWLLKGGQALLVRWPDARHSRDIDLFRTGTESDLESAVDSLREAAAIDLGDYFRFQYRDTRGEWHERATRKVRFTVHFGTKAAGGVSVDVVTNLVPRGRPLRRPLDSPLEIDLGADHAQVSMWPLEDHTADKIVAMYERHSGRVSTRYKDLVDLVLVALRAELEGEPTHEALHSEVSRRRAAGTHVELPSLFTVPDRASWTRGYHAQARAVPALLDGHRTLADCEPLLRRLIDPLLGATAPGRWKPVESAWSPAT